jgi:hypothetical protein
MLSDSVFECIEDMWKAIENYDYVDHSDHKEQLIETLTEMRYLLHRLDAFDRPLQDRSYIKKIIEDEWIERFQHMPPGCWLNR